MDKGYCDMRYKGVTYLVEVYLKEVKVKGNKKAIRACCKIADAWSNKK